MGIFDFFSNKAKWINEQYINESINKNEEIKNVKEHIKELQQLNNTTEKNISDLRRSIDVLEERTQHHQRFLEPFYRKILPLINENMNDIK